MDNIKSMEQSGARIQAALCDRRVVTEISSDFSLPDYQPEIKRLLHVRASVAPTDKYIGTGEAEFSGTVDYTILYSGNDGEIYCTSQTGEYRFSIPMESTVDFEIGDGIVCDVQTLPESPSGRVIAPRKLSVKCRLRSRVRLYGTRVLAETVRGASEESIQRLHRSAECRESFVGISDPIQLSDEILTDASEETLRVISADAIAYVSEATSGSGCVNCRGEVVLKLLCTHEGGNATPFSQFRRIPFTGSVPTDGAEVNCAACARGTATDVAITVEEGRILCDVSVRLEARAERNESVSFTEDAYSTEADGKCDVSTLRFPLFLRCHTGNFSLNTTLSLEEAGIRRDAVLADLNILPSVTALENENGRYVLSGKCRCYAMLCTEDDVAMQEFELPFRYVTEGSADTVSDYDADVVAISCRARADGERICVDAELAVNLITHGEREMRVLTEAVFSEPIERSGATYLICYPSREDTLWTVAKRYHRAVGDVARMNPIAEGPAANAADSLAGVRYLLM